MKITQKTLNLFIFVPAPQCQNSWTSQNLSFKWSYLSYFFHVCWDDNKIALIKTNQDVTITKPAIQNIKPDTHDAMLKKK